MCRIILRIQISYRRVQRQNEILATEIAAIHNEWSLEEKKFLEYEALHPLRKNFNRNGYIVDEYFIKSISHTKYDLFIFSEDLNSISKLPLVFKKAVISNFPKNIVIRLYHQICPAQVPSGSDPPAA